MRRPQASAEGPGSLAVGGNVGSASVTYIGAQVLGGLATPVAVAAKDPRPVFSAVGVDAFTGREWLAGEVDQFIESNPCGYLFIEAEAGLGKTAFAAWLVKTRGLVSHFSHYAGGRQARAALQNISAQLIRDFGLDDQAPGNVVPEWAQAPAGFESLLGAAADQARVAGHRLILVVDGMDEAELSGDGLPFGLPDLLPDGVYVIGTYRTGWSPARPGTPSATLRISKDDHRNKRDIRKFIHRAVSEKNLAARLAEAGVDPPEFVDILAGRCDGIWVYLRYVLHELRIGLRQPEALGELPMGLRDYYYGSCSSLSWRLVGVGVPALVGLLGLVLVAASP